MKGMVSLGFSRNCSLVVDPMVAVPARGHPQSLNVF